MEGVVMVHTLHRTDLPENGAVTLERAGRQYLIADIEGDVVAFVVSGPVVAALEHATIAEGHLRCPLHGWPIDPEMGRCGAAEFCRYEPVPVAVEGSEIRVGLPDL
jgi:nitrite reductase/ring-hydroxylating ferredoxin subunit